MQNLFYNWEGYDEGINTVTSCNKRGELQRNDYIFLEVGVSNKLTLHNYSQYPKNDIDLLTNPKKSDDKKLYFSDHSLVKVDIWVL